MYKLSLLVQKIDRFDKHGKLYNLMSPCCMVCRRKVCRADKLKCTIECEKLYDVSKTEKSQFYMALLIVRYGLFCVLGFSSFRRFVDPHY